MTHNNVAYIFTKDLIFLVLISMVHIGVDSSIMMVCSDEHDSILFFILSTIIYNHCCHLFMVFNTRKLIKLKNNLLLNLVSFIYNIIFYLSIIYSIYIV